MPKLLIPILLCTLLFAPAALAEYVLLRDSNSRVFGAAAQPGLTTKSGFTWREVQSGVTIDQARVIGSTATLNSSNVVTAFTYRTRSAVQQRRPVVAVVQGIWEAHVQDLMQDDSWVYLTAFTAAADGNVNTRSVMARTALRGIVGWLSHQTFIAAKCPIGERPTGWSAPQGRAFINRLAGMNLKAQYERLAALHIAAGSSGLNTWSTYRTSSGAPARTDIANADGTARAPDAGAGIDTGLDFPAGWDPFNVASTVK